MIAQLTGTLSYKSPQQIIIDIGGVGYCLTTSLTTFAVLPDEGQQVTLSVHTHVREDALTLYGFASPDEKRMFQQLIAVSGIGPKVGLAILSGIPPANLATAITGGDTARLNAIPGVGRKTAERIIVDLRDKLSKDPSAILGEAALPANTPMYDDALSALTNLGYTKAAAEQALKKIDWSSNIQLETAIRDALRELVPQ